MKSIFTSFIISLFIFNTFLFPQDKSSNDNKLPLNNFLHNNISNGIDLNISYYGDLFANLYGGIETNSTYFQQISIVLDTDLGKLVSIQHSSIYLQLIGDYGRDINKYVGTEQGISNIASYNTFKVLQFYLESKLLNDRLSLLLGLFDLNMEFDVRNTSAIFLNPSHGIGAEYASSGKNGPSIFPNSSVAFRLKYEFPNDIYLLAAAFDGIPGTPDNPNSESFVISKNDGLLLSFETGLDNQSSNFYKYSIGAWYYTSNFVQLTNSPSSKMKTVKGNYGAYLSAERKIFSESEIDDQGLSVFFRFGINNRKINKIDSYLGAGLNYQGLFPGREKDILGLAIASSRNNSTFISYMESEGINLYEYETNLELTYEFHLSSDINVQPDFQYIINPEAAYNNTNSFLIGTRLKMYF